MNRRPQTPHPKSKKSELDLDDVNVQQSTMQHSMMST
jgi:hypothetical protein